MTATKKIIQDPDLAGVEAALLRAGERAREIAIRTRTPLIIYKDGKIKKYRVYKKDISQAFEAERFASLSQRESFDYTKIRQELGEDLSIKKISQKAMALRKKSAE